MPLASIGRLGGAVLSPRRRRVVFLNYTPRPLVLSTTGYVKDLDDGLHELPRCSGKEAAKCRDTGMSG
jgi:hypothetical protein